MFFDAYYHFASARKNVKRLKKYTDMQVIFTTYIQRCWVMTYFVLIVISSLIKESCDHISTAQVEERSRKGTILRRFTEMAD